jgi:hypothetical protein
MTQWGEDPIAFEIISERIAKKYYDFFYNIWNKINKGKNK